MAASKAVVDVNIAAAQAWLAKAYVVEGKYTDAKALFTAVISRGTLFARVESILQGHDVGAADPITPIETAEADLKRAASAFNRHHPKLARALVSHALAAEEKARHDLGLVPIQAPIPPPTGSGLQACALVESQSPTAGATIEVKVADSTGTNITVTFTVGSVGTPQSKTGIVGSAGTVFVGPFGPYPDATPEGASINVNASNPTTGQTGSLPFTFPFSASTAPACDCTLHK